MNTHYRLVLATTFIETSVFHSKRIVFVVPREGRDPAKHTARSDRSGSKRANRRVCDLRSILCRIPQRRRFCSRNEVQSVRHADLPVHDDAHRSPLLLRLLWLLQRRSSYSLLSSFCPRFRFGPDREGRARSARRTPLIASREGFPGGAPNQRLRSVSAAFSRSTRSERCENRRLRQAWQSVPVGRGGLLRVYSPHVQLAVRQRRGDRPAGLRQLFGQPGVSQPNQDFLSRHHERGDRGASNRFGRRQSRPSQVQRPILQHETHQTRLEEGPNRIQRLRAGAIPRRFLRSAEAFLRSGCSLRRFVFAGRTGHSPEIHSALRCLRRAGVARYSGRAGRGVQEAVRGRVSRFVCSVANGSGFDRREMRLSFDSSKVQILFGNAEYL